MKKSTLWITVSFFAAGAAAGGVWGIMTELAGNFGYDFYPNQSNHLIEAFLKHFKYAVLLWFAAPAGHAGFVCVFAALFVKGIGLGFSGASVMTALGARGFADFFVKMTLPQNLIVVCAYIFMAYTSVEHIRKKRTRISPKLMTSAGVGFAACLIAAMLEEFILPILMKNVVY
jgi:preprotein translocase subunit SecG